MVTLMTEHHGRVRAVAKGIRRTSSKFGSRLEPTTHVSLQLYLGRELDTVTQAETIAPLPTHPYHLPRFGHAHVLPKTLLPGVPPRDPHAPPSPLPLRPALPSGRPAKARRHPHCGAAVPTFGKP